MNEDRKTSGISHLLEHILTESWKKCKDDCAKYWGNKGIITNASTGDTTVNYYVEGLEKNYQELIEYIVKITTAPQFKESRIEVEKKAVKEELKRELNDDGWKIADKISNLLYSFFLPIMATILVVPISRPTAILLFSILFDFAHTTWL